jgi:hypothetical protein
MAIIKRMNSGRFGIFDEKSGEQLTDQTYSRENDAYRGYERMQYRSKYV